MEKPSRQRVRYYREAKDLRKLKTIEHWSAMFRLVKTKRRGSDVVGNDCDEIKRNKLLDWPSQSPDLNLIEHIWDKLDRRVRRRSYSNKDQFFATLLEEWSKLPHERLQNLVDSMPNRLNEALNKWYEKTNNFAPPQNPAIQKAWDEIIAGQILDSLISSFTSDKDIARLKALQEKESGSWLHALPSSYVGTLMDGKSFQIATALRLGCKICHVHQCICGETVDSFGHHALSCARSKGRIPRHSAINNIISRSLTSCDIPTLLEPSGISRSDGKRPDGLTLIPWSKGKSLIWDFTCVDTLALSHLKSSVNYAGSAAESAYHAKRRKYEHLTSNYIFVAFAVETFGPWCRDAKDLLTQIGTRLLSRTRRS
ncbi:hypothetical protein ANN_26892 [Periplaneta americana]|uniref:Uncharacterized protein n=1 Tax=Periplaneta americana TaxID=6978 RepID=A0ABQ8RWM2_PERAM|nr:hypothetical protein ANN_26892 [Periplaneta americana]